MVLLLEQKYTQTLKIKIPQEFWSILDLHHTNAKVAVDRMLADRSLNSTKHYKDLLPSNISKALIDRYQRNKRGIRIPRLFKKNVIPVFFPKPIQGFIRNVEFLKRDGVWYGNICYNILTKGQIKPTGTVGVDFSSVGSVATLSDPQNGKVLHMGFNPAKTKEIWRNRKSKLQKEGKKRLLHVVKNKQSRRTTYENHAVSRQIVNYAVEHRRAIVVENLSGVMKGKIAKYTQKKSQWSFYQLKQFLLYKAALYGVVVIEANPAYTSQECSRCHQISQPNGKRFLCGFCRHNDHRDANAGFNLASRVSPICGVVQESESLYSGILVAPSPGTEVEIYA